jgi:RNA polymerase I-specific transcription initiation factor RRN7
MANLLLEKFKLTELPVAQQLLDHGPLHELPPRPFLTSDLEQSVNRLKQVQNNLIVQKSKVAESVVENITRPGELYKRYRTVQELPANAKIFYEIAGKPLR